MTWVVARSARGRTRSSACRAAARPGRAQTEASARARRPGAGAVRSTHCSRRIELPRRRQAPVPSARVGAPAPRGRAARTRPPDTRVTAVSRRPPCSETTPIGRSRYAASTIETPRSARGGCGSWLAELSAPRALRARRRASPRSAAANGSVRAAAAAATRTRPRPAPTPRHVRRPTGATASTTSAPNTIVASTAPVARRRRSRTTIATSAPTASARRLAGADRPEDPAPLERPEAVAQALGSQRPLALVLGLVHASIDRDVGDVDRRDSGSGSRLLRLVRGRDRSGTPWRCRPSLRSGWSWLSGGSCGVGSDARRLAGHVADACSSHATAIVASAQTPRLVLRMPLASWVPAPSRSAFRSLALAERCRRRAGARSRRAGSRRSRAHGVNAPISSTTSPMRTSVML